MPEDIRFYVYAPNKYRDMVEKQINASYPDAEIKISRRSQRQCKEGYIIGNEYNIFSKEGKVAFAPSSLKSQITNQLKFTKI